MEDKKIIIQLFTDYICPFCYMGKRNLENAIKELNMEGIVQVYYKTYELDREADKNNSKSKIESLNEELYKSSSEIKAYIEDIVEQGKTIGLKYDFNKMVTSNTHNAHKLTKLATIYNKHIEFSEKIMEGYFTKGLNLNDNEKLLDIIETVGISRNEAKEVLLSDKFEDEIAQDKYDAFQYQVKSIPFFLIDNRYGSSGKQDINVFKEALRKLAEFY